MKLIKLVYIAHGWMLGLYGRPLFHEDVEAWRYGPVIRELYHEIKKFRARAVPVGQIALSDDASEFDEYEKGVMNQVHDVYGTKYSALQLSKMTHSPGTPWDIVYNKMGQDFVIPNDLIEHHYADLYRKYGKSDSRELNQDVARTKRVTKSGPVFITTRGKPSHVLLSIEDYRRLAGERLNLVDALSMAGLGEIDLDPPRSRIEIPFIKEELP